MTEILCGCQYSGCAILYRQELGQIKQVDIRFVKGNSPIYTCLTVTSKGFDIVDLYKLFEKLLDRDLPARFLLMWHRTQMFSVR